MDENQALAAAYGVMSIPSFLLFKGGQVVGESDATASNPVSRPVSPQDFLGSIYACCGIDPEGPLPNSKGKKMPLLPPQSSAGRLRELYTEGA